MRRSGRLAPVISVLLGGCGNQPLAGPGPTPTMAETVSLAIEGFPTSRSLRVGSGALLFIGDAPEVRRVFWSSSDPRAATVTPVPAMSPCGERCAWLNALACGSARIEARVCFLDGSCGFVSTARVCDHARQGCLDVPADLRVE